MTEKVSNAVDFVIAKHKGQKRKDGSKYFYHPLRVAADVRDLGEDYEIAGMFHDLLEDTDATEEEILALSSADVLEAVKLVTKDGRSKEQYINDILANPIAKAVKNADRIDNLTDALTGELSFISSYLDETRKYYLGRFSPELDEAYDKLEDVYKKRTTYMYTINGSLMNPTVYRSNKLKEAQVFKNGQWIDTDPYFWANMGDDAEEITEAEAMEIIAESSTNI